MGTELLFLIVATALLSSVLTVGIGVVVFKFLIKPQLDQQLDSFSTLLQEKVKQGVEEAGQNLLADLEKSVRQGCEQAAEEEMPEFRRQVSAGFVEAADEMLPKFRQELSEGFEETAEELLPQFQRQLRKAFEEAAEELLPIFRQEVEEGFQEALLSIAKGTLVDKAAHKVVQTGSSIVETGLNILLGSRYEKD